MAKEQLEVSRERFEELEKAKERIRESVHKAYQYGREGGRGVGSLLTRLGHREQNIKHLMKELKDKAEDEAVALNEKYDNLINEAMRAVKDLHDFEIDELEMKEENAVDGEVE